MCTCAKGIKSMRNRLPLKREWSSACFQWGEFVLSEDGKARQRLFRLKEGGMLNSSSGQVEHKDIAGREPCQKFSTNIGSHLWLRRPSLAEYVCLMQRSATPTYPKDIWAMLGYLDIGEGSRVVEAGSGSGALTLHLSSRVGASGQVYSFENVQRHHSQAKTNFRNWTSSWNSHHPHNSWPDNVCFFESNVSKAADHIESSVDAVALDLVHPYSVVDKLVSLLRPGSVMAAYLPNVTQVLDLRVHLEKSQLPLKWERIVEVVHRNWTVKPAVSKHRAAQERLQKSDNSVDVFPAAYIARPSHHQDPHTDGTDLSVNGILPAWLRHDFQPTCTVDKRESSAFQTTILGAVWFRILSSSAHESGHHGETERNLKALLKFVDTPHVCTM